MEAFTQIFDPKKLVALARQLIVLAVAFGLAKAIQYGIVSTGTADILLPLIMAVVDEYLTKAVTVAAFAVFNAYLLYVQTKLTAAAQSLPADSTDKEVAEKALGNGMARTFARVLKGTS